MSTLLGLNRLNIQIPDAGVVRIVAGATVTVYNTMADGTAAVTASGVVSNGAVKSTLYADRRKVATKANPLIADSQGLVEFYVDKAEVHIQVVTPRGITYGIPWYFVSTFTDISESQGYISVQDEIDALPASGGIITLPVGTYQGFEVNKANVDIRGAGEGTVIAGSVLVSISNSKLRNMTIRATGQPYGVKLFRESGGGVARCLLEEMFIGASFQGAGDGPAKGLWLDGAILTKSRGITVGFCTESGIYIDTSDPLGAWSTNVNNFHGCTSNLNGRYGAEIIGGAVQSPRFYDGNIEGNTLGAVYIRSTISAGFYGTDFEGNQVIAAVIDAGACNSLEIIGCQFNFGPPPGTATRAIALGTCTANNISGNRGQGFTAKDWISIDENCVACVANRNTNPDGNDFYVRNRGYR